MRVRNRLGLFLQSNKISALQLSKEIDINYAAVMKFYNEEYKQFKPDLIVKLCEYFNCNIEDLIYLDD
ncbi:helix-turn-helix transcriptional regulator [Virgibacillus sp. Bac332]|uniref:helix-turn-helix domain-containing protein n=1 Tax=Virgibacillus sp. Bac332 TaxID=2419842 RepID=UPI000EF5010E|nr:helix-turn-helix transcriptional regulator [Virgibacillus sp. Bac332]